MRRPSPSDARGKQIQLLDTASHPHGLIQRSSIRCEGRRRVDRTRVCSVMGSRGRTEGRAQDRYDSHAVHVDWLRAGLL